MAEAPTWCSKSRALRGRSSTPSRPLPPPAPARRPELLRPRTCKKLRNVKTKPQNSDRFVIIMAGGRGERFWPVSRQATPKQLITLLGKRSFLQEAVDRVLPIVPARNILI